FHCAFLDLASELAQLIARVHDALLGILGHLVTLLTHPGRRLLDVLGRLVLLALGKRLLSTGHTLVGLARAIARGLSRNRRDGDHKNRDQEFAARRGNCCRHLAAPPSVVVVVIGSGSKFRITSVAET